MKNLIEIARIVTKKKVRKIEIFDDNALKQKNSKFNEFYEGLQQQKFKNDRDAATLLYGTSPTDDKYRQLKSRFRRRLLNTLFFLDVNQPSTSNYERAYFSSNKDWTLIKILLANDAVLTATSMAKQVLTTALKYRFADLIVNCSRILRQQAAEREEEKDFEQYDQHLRHFQKVLESEFEAEALFQRIHLHYRSQPVLSTEAPAEVVAHCEELVRLSEMHESPVIYYQMYLAWAYRFEMQADYHSMLEVCERAEQYVEQHPLFYQESKLAAFQLKKMMAYLHLRDFTHGKANAEKALTAFPKGSDVWFTFLEYYFLLAMHTQNYINALAIYYRATEHSKFRKLPAEIRQKWDTFNIYLNYLVEALHDEQPVLSAQRKKAFRINRLLNDPVLFPRNQRIFTALVLLGQILFLLKKKSFTQATERIDRLKGYTTQPLKKEDHPRLFQFIRLLQQLAKAEFQPAQLSGAEKYLQRLHDMPFLYRGDTKDLEILPYEHLWGMLLQQLR